MDTSTDEEKTSSKPTRTYIRPKPSQDIIERRFKRLKSNMQVAPDQILRMDGLSLEEKWKIVNDQPALKSCLHDVRYYVTQLKGHTDPHIHLDASMKKSSWKKAVKSLAPVKEVIEDLKEDLHSAQNDFLKSFISEGANGVQLLSDFLQQTQELIERDRGAKAATSPGQAPPSKQGTLDKKQIKLLDNIRRTTNQESDTVNCLRKISEDEDGLRIIMTSPDVLETIATCIVSRSLSARLYAFMVLIAACEARDGLNCVLSCLSKFRIKIKEKVRFYAIAQMIVLESSRLELVTICLRFINTMLSSTEDMNKRIYLQYELELADFNPIKIERHYRLEGEIPPSVKQELDVWHSRYISIQKLQDNLMTMESRNALLRKEVDRQGYRLGEYEAENSALQTKVLEVVARSDEFRERVNELQDTIEKLTREYTKKTGQHAEKKLKNFDNLMKPLEPEDEVEELTVVVDPFKHGERKLERKKSVAGDKKKELVISKPKLQAPAPPRPPTPPPAPPTNAPGVPAPPPLFGTMKQSKHRPTSKHPLPLLNWNTLPQPGNTIFKVLDDDHVYEELDFQDFEDHFRLKEASATTAIMEKLKRVQERHAKKLRLVATNRAKNLIITQRRIGLSPKDIRRYVDRCDTSGVPGEYAELLLNFLPTKEELRALAENSDKYENMGEAEQFMFQMARVDRYESKLRLMTFMGIYHELVATLKPEIQAIVFACDSIVTSGKLKKIMEIILAFGNFMNCAKRGAATGYKLESLQRLTFVKSTDRSHNLLNYLVATVDQCYPELKTWHEDLKFHDLKSASLEALTMDIHGLRKGLELTKFERERQLDNPIIGQFYVDAADTIHALSEGFKKMEEIYHYTCGMFGENPQYIEPANFFQLFKAFKHQYLAAEQENKANPLDVTPTRKPGKRNSPFNATQYALPHDLPSSGISGRLGLFRRSISSETSPRKGTSTTTSSSSSRRDSPTSSDSGIASVSSGDNGSAQSIPYVSTDGPSSGSLGGVTLTANGTPHTGAQDGSASFWGLFSGMK